MVQKKFSGASPALHPLSVYLLGGVLDQSSGVTFATGLGLGADVDEVPGAVVVFTEDALFRVVQQGQELVEEALPAFLG